MSDKIPPNLLPIAFDVIEGGIYRWCGCGKSKTQPLCDRADCTKSVTYHSTLNETVYFCGCKQTRDPPLCDGTHGKLVIEYLKNRKK